jgi:hypothetical protein
MFCFLSSGEISLYSESFRFRTQLNSPNGNDSKDFTFNEKENPEIPVKETGYNSLI